jgi:hypothetical protein
MKNKIKFQIARDSSKGILRYKEQLIGLDHEGGRKFTFLKYNGNF